MNYGEDTTGLRAHAKCPIQNCVWRSTSWSDNAGRVVAPREWEDHKKIHTRFGPWFINEDAPNPTEALGDDGL